MVQDLPDTELFQEPLKDQSPTDLPGFDTHLTLSGEHQQDLLEKPRQRVLQGFRVTNFLQTVQPPHNAEEGWRLRLAQVGFRAASAIHSPPFPG